MTAAVSSAQRFTAHQPCPVCGGDDRLPRGQGERCYGFLSTDRAYAHCTRPEHAGGLPEEEGGTFAHRLDGPCNCGATHGNPPPAETVRQNGAAVHASRDDRRRPRRRGSGIVNRRPCWLPRPGRRFIGA